MKIIFIILLPILLYSQEKRFSKTFEPSKDKGFATPISEQEVLEDLNRFFSRFNKYEFSMRGSFEKQKGVFTEHGFAKDTYLTTSVMDGSFYYLLNGYLQPGLGLNWQKLSGAEFYSARLRLITNFKNMYKEKLVPYLLLGIGYMIYEFERDISGGSGVILPEFVLGVRYFLISNIALNIGFGYERGVINSETSSKNGLSIGISTFL